MSNPDVDNGRGMISLAPRRKALALCAAAVLLAVDCVVVESKRRNAASHLAEIRVQRVGAQAKFAEVIAKKLELRKLTATWAELAEVFVSRKRMKQYKEDYLAGRLRSTITLVRGDKDVSVGDSSKPKPSREVVRVEPAPRVVVNLIENKQERAKVMADLKKRIAELQLAAKEFSEAETVVWALKARETDLEKAQKSARTQECLLLAGIVACLGLAFAGRQKEAV